jgi:hypothetical protein
VVADEGPRGLQRAEEGGERAAAAGAQLQGTPSAEEGGLEGEDDEGEEHGGEDEEGEGREEAGGSQPPPSKRGRGSLPLVAFALRGAGPAAGAKPGGGQQKQQQPSQQGAGRPQQKSLFSFGFQQLQAPACGEWLKNPGAPGDFLPAAARSLPQAYSWSLGQVVHAAVRIGEELNSGGVCFLLPAGGLPNAIIACACTAQKCELVSFALTLHKKHCAAAAEPSPEPAASSQPAREPPLQHQQQQEEEEEEEEGQSQGHTSPSPSSAEPAGADGDAGEPQGSQPSSRGAAAAALLAATPAQQAAAGEEVVMVEGDEAEAAWLPSLPTDTSEALGTGDAGAAAAGRAAAQRDPATQQPPPAIKLTKPAAAADSLAPLDVGEVAPPAATFSTTAGGDISVAVDMAAIRRRLLGAAAGSGAAGSSQAAQQRRGSSRFAAASLAGAHGGVAGDGMTREQQEQVAGAAALRLCSFPGRVEAIIWVMLHLTARNKQAVGSTPACAWQAATLSGDRNMQKTVQLLLSCNHPKPGPP